MFDFFFKKRATTKLVEAKLVAATKPRIQQKEPVQVVKAASNVDIDKHVEKQADLALAASFTGQEDAAVAFILQSEYADARQQAVIHIHSQQALMKVSQAMRNTDRRVSKLVQEKLAQIQTQQKMKLAVQACLLQGQRLLENSPLMVNQVAQWDKERLALGEHGLSLLPIKVELENRLQAQLDLQRQVIKIVDTLRTLVETELPLAQSQMQLAQCVLQWQNTQSSPLAASLPKNQCSQLNNELALAQSHVQQLEEAIERANTALIKPTATPTLSVINTDEEDESKKRLSKKLKPVQEVSIDIKSVVAELEQALEDGSLQQALDIDKTLRHAEIPTRGEIASRLHALRAELNRLLDWAKWGGSVSREELIKVADGLLENKLSAQEIIKQVGGLRARWKELDKTSGAAAKLVWERFNEACDRAFQVANAQFKQQAQVRLDNLYSAQAYLAEIDNVISTLKNRFPDWKSHQEYINKAKIEWRKIGPVDRKMKSRLEAEFEQKITILLQPLNAVREVSIGIRQQLIDSVKQIVATERHAVDKVKQAQQRWQQEALNLPLERKKEQELWRQFRAACDMVFAQRKATLDEQTQRRSQVILAMQACCEEVEQWVKTCSNQLSNQTSSKIVTVLRQAKQEWRNLSSQLGQHRQESLGRRFNTAVNELEKCHFELVIENKKAGLINLRAKMMLCLQIETATEINDAAVEFDVVERITQWQAEWESLAIDLIPLELNKLLSQRFNSALAGVKDRPMTDAKKSAANKANVAQFDELLLRIEVFRGLASPTELAHQRLHVHVNELKSAMKDRQFSDTYLANLYTLCALPVKLSAQQEQRLQLILDDYMNQKS